MRTLKTIIVLICCLLPIACGNKGDLFLVPDQVTEKQLETVDEALEAIKQSDDLPSATPDAEETDDDKPGRTRKNPDTSDS
ncbi:MAG: hypothetical protein V3U76_01640 [Granulosicoccus sp.]